MTATITLPWPPSTNNAYAVRNGRKVKTTEARAYAREIVFHVSTKKAWRALKNELRTVDRLKVSITAHYPDNRRRDLANLEKLVTDAIFTWLGVDDSQITDLRLTRGENKPDGALVYTVEAA